MVEARGGLTCAAAPAPARQAARCAQCRVRWRGASIHWVHARVSAYCDSGFFVATHSNFLTHLVL